MTSPSHGDKEAEAESVVSFNVANGGRKIR